MQITRKIKVEPIVVEGIKEFLKKENFDFHPNQNAFWRASYKNENGSLTVILFNNLSLFFQGDEKLVEKYSELISKNFLPSSRHTGILGLDESGKGDCFGPLVLAGAIIRNEASLLSLNIDDCKKLTDERIKNIFNNLKDSVTYRVRIILPEEYNILYEEFKNLNLLMCVEYNKLIKSFNREEYSKIILDKFSISSKQINIIKDGIEKPMEIIPRAEENLVVALASVIARYYFIDWFDKQPYSLIKGCGDEARKLYKILKEELNENFSKIAKLHFKLD